MNVSRTIRRLLTGAARAVLLSGAAVLAAVAFATAFGSGSAHADAMNWDAVAQCESGGNWSANTGNGHFGGLQFKQATWSSNGGFGSPASASREEQIRVAENVLRSQGSKAWPKCGAVGGAPVAWNAPASPAGPATGCSAIRPGGVLGIVDLRTICSFLAPLVGQR